jgi:hypothetical protein
MHIEDPALTRSHLFVAITLAIRGRCQRTTRNKVQSSLAWGLAESAPAGDSVAGCVCAANLRAGPGLKTGANERTLGSLARSITYSSVQELTFY